MPPKSSFTSSFSATDSNNEVVCPLKNQDGSNCRKRCLGEKRYRSMQEHIRRAHAEHYIPKLPATEESFQLMINTPPSERPQPPPLQPPQPTQPFGNSVHGHDRDAYTGNQSSPAPARTLEDQYPAAATAAVALAQLHSHRPESEWESEADYASENDGRQRRMHSSIELPPIQNHINQQQTIPPFHSPRPRDLLPSMMARSPPGRSSTLPPLQRKESVKRDKANRPRKSSITQNSRRPKHEKKTSKDFARRLSIEGRKAFSAEPPGAREAAVAGRRWHDLVEAAASATEADSDRDLTPIPQSPPSSIKRASLPPFSSVSHNQSYKASPLGNALTPPPPHSLSGPVPFPSIETSHDSMYSSHSTQSSGHNFHIPSSGLSNSSDTTSPTFQTSGFQPVRIYCALCKRLSVLGESYACTECISGFCSDCVYRLSSEQHVGRQRPCPRCQALGTRYKPFQLDLQR